VGAALSIVCGLGLLVIYMNRNRWVRADGYLPLTRASRLKVDLWFWTTIALLPISFVVAAVGAFTSSTFVLFIGALILAGFVIMGLSYRLVVPGAKVSEPPTKFDPRWTPDSGRRGNLAELRHVHPAFV